jgi:HD-like signal output (HDOD) protein
MRSKPQKYTMKIPSLPTIPAVAQELLTALDDSLVSVDSLEEIIRKDAAISARVLSVANSAYFGYVKSETLSSAIMKIGTENVKSLTIGICLLTLFADGNKEQQYHYKKIYKHSVAVGVISRHLGRILRLPLKGSEMLCGVMHDIGLMIIVHYFFDEYRRILKLMESGIGHLQAEQEILEFTHPEIGGWVAEEWRLPDIACEVIRNHHTPSYTKNYHTLAALVHSADFLVSEGMLRSTPEPPGYLHDPVALDTLRLSSDRMADIRSELDNVPIFE